MKISTPKQYCGRITAKNSNILIECRVRETGARPAGPHERCEVVKQNSPDKLVSRIKLGNWINSEGSKERWGWWRVGK
jgi:hypothetical protein